MSAPEETHGTLLYLAHAWCAERGAYLLGVGRGLDRFTGRSFWMAEVSTAGGQTIETKAYTQADVIADLTKWFDMWGDVE